MNPTDYPTFRAAACDLNGRMRGKRLPASYAAKLDQGAVRMPISVINLDIFGADIEDSPLVFASGDADGMLRPTERGPVTLPWLETDPVLVPMAMHNEDGSAYAGDPRHALAGVLARFARRGWRVIAATELEFTLVDDGDDTLEPVRDPVSGRPLIGSEITSISQLDAFEPFLSELYAGCATMGIPAQAASSESGVGQFEITITHQEAMRAVDDTWLFKRLIRRVARKHGFAATFMAKPFAQDAGNGLHVHFSVLDETGRNIFDNGAAEGTDLLLSAIAGCVAAMRESTLIFAPHSNSYARMIPGAHAPTGICWAYENRTAAIRVPGGAPAARRIEHRTAGGDTNPYLVLAAILGAAMIGIEDGLKPPKPIEGNAYDIDLEQISDNWAEALELFLAGPMIARIFPALLIENMGYTKRQERRLMAERPEQEHWKVYLETV